MRRMIERDQRRALPSRRDIGRAEIRDHIHAELCARARAIEELAGKTLARPVQHGLAMEADDGDAAFRDAKFL